MLGDRMEIEHVYICVLGCCGVGLLLVLLPILQLNRSKEIRSKSDALVSGAIQTSLYCVTILN